MKCWKCQKELEGIEKIGFRTECDACSAGQHACVNCEHYMPGKPNDCFIPGTDFVRDREANNFCESYAVKVGQAPSSSNTSAFDDLFK